MKEVIETIDTTLYINSVLPIYTGQVITSYKFFTCDTLHLRAGRVIGVVNNNTNISYVIKEVLLNEYVEVTVGTELQIPYPKTATTYAINFFSGKLSDTAMEINDFQSSKTPFFWMREPYESSKDGEFSSNKNYSIVSYLLDDSLMCGESNSGAEYAWTTESHHLNVIDPMDNVWNKRVIPRIEQLKKYFIDWQNERVRPHSNVGQETEKGSDRSLFEMKLSGVEVRIDLDVSIMNCCD
jgi:hypothetical protein